MLLYLTFTNEAVFTNLLKLYLVEIQLYYYCHNVDTPGINHLNIRFLLQAKLRQSH